MLAGCDFREEHTAGFPHIPIGATPTIALPVVVVPPRLHAFAAIPCNILSLSKCGHAVFKVLTGVFQTSRDTL